MRDTQKSPSRGEAEALGGAMGHPQGPAFVFRQG